MLVGAMFVVAGVLWLLGARYLAARHGARADAARARAAHEPTGREGGPGTASCAPSTRLLLKLFYARIEVVGAEHVPASGPADRRRQPPQLARGRDAPDGRDPAADAHARQRAALSPPPDRPVPAPDRRAPGAPPPGGGQRRRSRPQHGPLRGDDRGARGGRRDRHLPGGDAPSRSPSSRSCAPERRACSSTPKARAAGPSVTLLPVGLVFDRPGTFRERPRARPDRRARRDRGCLAGRDAPPARAS